MNKSGTVVVVGLGEVGKPLFQLISETHEAVGVDITPLAEEVTDVDVLHICIPFQIKDFVGETARYIKQFNPKLTVVNSTVAVGTTRAVAERAGRPVAYSPVRGKHARMLEDMRRYTKFIGANDPLVGEVAAKHFQSLGLKTRVLASTDAAELAKLTETTFFGLMIAWAQEVERYADRIGADYADVISFYDEIAFFPPVKYFPGVIGGHCVMPNIELLSKFQDSEILKSIESSNKMKIERDKTRK